MKTRTSAGEAGFSLAELTVAMLITLIISGAIYGLLASGQSSFRREPQLTDRQQNIRVAMDMMVRDLANAGADVPAWLQVFARDMNGTGPLGVGGIDTLSNDAHSDKIRFYGQDGNCPSLNVCAQGQGASLTTRQLVPSCYGMPGPVLLWTNAANTDCASCATVMWGCLPGQGANHACGGGQSNGGNGHSTYPPGASNLNPPGGAPWIPDGMSAVGVNQWEIRVDSAGVPNLWRTNLGGVTQSGGGSNCTSTALDTNGGWGMVARGIEDMQIEYLSQANQASDTWVVNPPDVMAAQGNYGTTVIKVRVTLSARVLERELAGQTNSATDLGSSTARVRGRLTQEVTPRAALMFLASASPTPLYR